MTPFHLLMMMLPLNALVLSQVAATNSTINRRPAYGDGHLPGRQLMLETDHFKEFRTSEKNIVEISGERYQIGSEIGSGFSGIVYKATHVKTGNPVAIKVTINNASADSELRKRATKEIEFLKVLKKSKNVVTILNWGVTDSSVAIVLELCTMDLEEWMETKNVFEIGFVQKRVISEFVPFFSSAIQQLREKYIAHNDLHSKNILQCGGVWKVSDFDRAVFVKTKGSRLFKDLQFVGKNLKTLVMGNTSYQHDAYLKKMLSLGALGTFIRKLLSYQIETLQEFYDEANEISSWWKSFARNMGFP